MEKLLTVDQMAEILQLKKSTVYSLVEHGKIPHIKLTGKLLRFRQSQIEEWLDGLKPDDPISYNRQNQQNKKNRGSSPKRDHIAKLIENARSEVLSGR